METRSGQNCNNKIAPQVSFLLAYCVSSLAVHFFLRRLLIIFSNVNYFNLSLVKFFIGSTNEFFHLYCKLFLTVLQIIFLLLILRIIIFSLALRISFHGIVNFYFWPTIHCGLVFEGDWLGCLTF